MKKMFHCAAAGLLLATLNAHLVPAHAQGTAFTYQGRLNAGGNPAGGLYDFRFKLYADPLGNTPVGGSYSTNAIPVTNGLFITTMDFGPGIFTGATNWLEVDVRTNAAPSYTASYTVLIPLQGVTPTPNALYAETAGNVSGIIPNSSLPASPTVSGAVTAGSFAGNGANVTNVNAAALDGLNATNFWQTGGNSGTTPGGNFLGTADNQPLELHVYGTRAFRLEPDTSGQGAPNVISGSPVNYVVAGTVGATIGGGGTTNYLGFTSFPFPNVIAANFGTIGGGTGNTIQTNANYATISGGGLNQIQTNALLATIGGGTANVIQTNAQEATIGGGSGNQIGYNSTSSTIGGGENNQIQPVALNCTIAGGNTNVIQTETFSATVGGGYANQIGANSHYAAIAGGINNQIQIGAYNAIIAGGGNNTIQNGAYNATIGGGDNNTIQTNSYNSMIGGGATNAIEGAIASAIVGGQQNTIQTNSDYSLIGGGSRNAVQGAVFSLIGGGYRNTIQTNANAATIGGGVQNTIQPNALGATIGGGYENYVSGNGGFIGGGGNDGSVIFGNTNFGTAAVIAGGLGNLIASGGTESVISGGYSNVISAGAYYATLGGGVNNAVSGAGGTVPGGNGNGAIGVNSFAAGTFAQATNDGAFVLSDSTYTHFYSKANNQFSARFGGGYRFFTGSSVLFTNSGSGQSVSWTPGAVSWSFTSDRNAKENFQPLDVQAVLAKVAQMPLTEWNYKGYADRHIGPMAQDFHAAFPLNPNDKLLNSADEAGITLAALQGLNQKVEEKDAKIQEQSAEIADLKGRLEKLEQLVTAKIGVAK